MPGRLQGVLFFGNGHALSSHLENVNCGAVIIDFAHVTSIDSSGFGQLEAVAKMLHKKKVRLIFGIKKGDLLKGMIWPHFTLKIWRMRGP